MGDVVILDVETTLPIPPERVLQGAIENNIEDVVVIGWNKKTKKLYLASSMAKPAEILLYLELGKSFIMRQVDG